MMKSQRPGTITVTVSSSLLLTVSLMTAHACNPMHAAFAVVEEKFYEEVPGNPAITRMAAQLQREGPIGDRLYNSAVEQQQRHRERVERAELEKIERAKAAAAFHSNTQRDLRNLASRGVGRGGGNIDNQNDGGNTAPQGHSLYNRAQQVLKKKDKLRQLESKAKEAQARPRLSKRSLRIANKLEKPSERLTKHTKQQMRELQMLSIKYVTKHARISAVPFLVQLR